MEYIILTSLGVGCIQYCGFYKPLCGVQGQVGRGFEQHNVAKDVPANGKEVGLDDL